MTYDNQLAELQMARQTSSLARNTLHETTISGEHWARICCQPGRAKLRDANYYHK